jgi:putative tricarboxylic transport membrane protein
MAFFGIVGYLMKKFKYEGAPLVLAYVLGPMIEKNLRQSLIISDGSFLTFLTRPISASALLICLVLLFGSYIPFLRRRKIAEVLEEAGD